MLCCNHHRDKYKLSEVCRQFLASFLRMVSRVTWKVLQYKLGDSLDKIRLPGNQRVLITKQDNTGCNLHPALEDYQQLIIQFVLSSTGRGSSTAWTPH